MPSLHLPSLLIVALGLLLGACQASPSTTELARLESSIDSDQLSSASRQLEQLRGEQTEDARLLALQRRLAEAYLQRGLEALDRGDLDAAAQALAQARGLMPQAPALTTGMDQAIDRARDQQR